MKFKFRQNYSIVIEIKSWFPGENKGWKLTKKGHRKFSEGTETLVFCLRMWL